MVIFHICIYKYLAMRDSVNLSYRMSSVLQSKFNLRLRLWEMQRRTLWSVTL